MDIDITELPDELVWTATMAAAFQSPACAAVLEGIADKLLEDIDDPEFIDRYKSLQRLFTENPPEGLDALAGFEAEKGAKWIIGLSGLTGAYMELEEAMTATIIEIMSGVKDSVLNFSREHR